MRLLKMINQSLHNVISDVDANLDWTPSIWDRWLSHAIQLKWMSYDSGSISIWAFASEQRERERGQRVKVNVIL